MMDITEKLIFMFLQYVYEFNDKELKEYIGEQSRDSSPLAASSSLLWAL